MKRTNRVAIVGLEDGPESCAGPGLRAALHASSPVAFACRAAESGAFRPGSGDAFELVGEPWRDAAEFERKLLDAVAAHRVSVVVPGSARVAVALAPLRPKLARAGAELLAASGASMATLAPSRLASTCRRARIRSIEGATIPPVATVETMLAALAWPVTLFGGMGLRRRAFDALEALRQTRALRELGADAVTMSSPNARSLQETCVVIGPRGALVAACSLRVLEDDPRLRPWLGVTIDDERLVESACKLAKAAKLTGPLTVTFVASEHGPLALDAQAAFPVWIEACLREGPNLPELAVAAWLGKKLPRPRHVAAGTLFSQTAHDIVVDPNSAAALALLR